MEKIIFSKRILLIIAILLLFSIGPAYGAIPGVEGVTTFTLVAKDGYISTGDGWSLYAWGYADSNSPSASMQYPGPTLIVNQGETITVNLINQLDYPVSIVFPGQTYISSTGDTQGAITMEANPGGGTAQYIFEASNAGTYMYHSGSMANLQVEMGLVGALIVRPSEPGWVYDHPDTAYDREYLFLLTEMDPSIHLQMEFGNMASIDTSSYYPVLWFINGRNAVDTLAPAEADYLPTQPYNCLPQMHPGERILLRFIGAGRDMHPFHHHANNATTIAHDGRMLESNPGVSGPDLAVSDFTEFVYPGGTKDVFFTWTGEDLGWDIYGHAPGDTMEPNEWADDHEKPFPVILPELQDMAIGSTYSGSPFLGELGPLPPGQGIHNLAGSYFFMWHSHHEKEICNWDIFPGGMMTMVLIHHPSLTIQE